MRCWAFSFFFVAGEFGVAISLNWQCTLGSVNLRWNGMGWLHWC